MTEEIKQELANTTEKGVEVAFKKNVDAMIANRDYFKSQLESIMVESQDYHVIKGKKSLSKGGAEKLATGFKLTAKFEIDKETQEIFKEVKGIIAYRCKLYGGDEFKGEGGGADTLSRNANDPNKTIKMAQKRAYVDAVIRTTGLSDIFTQDLEDMDPKTIGNTQTPNYQPKTSQRAEFAQPAQSKTYINDPNKLASDAQQYKILKMLEDLGLSVSFVENKTGPLKNIKMGVASQVIEQLQKKIDNLGDSNIKQAEIVYPCEKCGETLTPTEYNTLSKMKENGYSIIFRCKKCVENNK